MANCRGCGAESNRTSASYDSKGALTKEVCSACDPQHFSDPFVDPTDRKLYTGVQARPQDYKTYKIDGEDVLFAKDELIQDTEDRWSNSIWDQAVEAKRKTARREPMSKDEIQAAENWARDVLRPWLEKETLNRKYAHTDG